MSEPSQYNSGGGDDLTGLDLSHVTPIPGGEAFEKLINKFNQKAAGAAWSFFKRHLATVTEPFFRKDMGERYFTYETWLYGAAFYILATLVSVRYTAEFSFAGALCGAAGWYRLGGLCQSPLLVVGAGIFMSYWHIKLGRQGFGLMLKYRNEGVMYHTRSRGVSRWGDHQLFVFIGLDGFLMLFNWPIGGLFLAGFLMNMKIRDEQMAAIMSRYYDALDRHVVNTCLEDAALGDIPTEITYLDKPIDSKLSPVVRKSVAASLVGKPVTGLAKPPRRKASSDQPHKSEPKSVDAAPPSDAVSEKASGHGG